jgi:hypothetical protein
MPPRYASPSSTRMYLAYISSISTYGGPCADTLDVFQALGLNDIVDRISSLVSELEQALTFSGLNARARTGWISTWRITDESGRWTPFPPPASTFMSTTAPRGTVRYPPCMCLAYVYITHSQPHGLPKFHYQPSLWVLMSAAPA